MEKPGKKAIAIAFSDIHINLWSRFNEGNKRTLLQIEILSMIREAMEEHKVGSALFTGDFFHKPENIDSEIFDLVTQKRFSDVFELYECYGISGNHDFKYSNRVTKRSPSLLNSLSKFTQWLTCVDFKSVNIGVAYIHGVPYLDRNVGLNEWVANIKLSTKLPNILMLHTDYPGAKDNDGTEVGSVENLNTNLLNKFDLVIIGHIHKPQRLSKKVYMVGATHQQRRTDRGCELGYMVIYNDMSVKHISLSDRLPKFIDVETPEEVLDDGNYYTVIGKKLEEKVTENNINIGLSRKAIVRRYLRANGIKDSDKKKLLINTLNKVEDD